MNVWYRGIEIIELPPHEGAWSQNEQDQLDLYYETNGHPRTAAEKIKLFERERGEPRDESADVEPSVAERLHGYELRYLSDLGMLDHGL